jgi:hypothetical protein
VQAAEWSLHFSPIQEHIKYKDYTFAQKWFVVLHYQVLEGAAVRAEIEADYEYVITRNSESDERLPYAPYKVLMAHNYSFIELLIVLLSGLYAGLHLRSYLLKRELSARQQQQRPYLPWLELLSAGANLGTGVLFAMRLRQTTLNKLAGVCCWLCWLCVSNYMGNIKNVYFIRLLLEKSPPFLIRWLVSSLPLFLGMALQAHIMFARYCYQFASWYESGLALFYICYYNMNFEEMSGTQRADFNLVFFFSFTVIFTYVVFGSLLVSMFLAFAWDRAEEERTLEIILQLQIFCPQC